MVWKGEQGRRKGKGKGRDGKRRVKMRGDGEGEWGEAGRKREREVVQDLNVCINSEERYVETQQQRLKKERELRKRKWQEMSRNARSKDVRVSSN